MDWITIGICVGVFYLGIFIGIIMEKWLRSRHTFSGVIHVIVNPDKTLFSLELSDDPEDLIFMSEVSFKVITTESADENPDRE